MNTTLEEITDHAQQEIKSYRKSAQRGGLFIFRPEMVRVGGWKATREGSLFRNMNLNER